MHRIASTGAGRLFHNGSNDDVTLSRDPRDWDPVIARDWWSKHVLGKTFIECRSFLMIYRRGCICPACGCAMAAW